MTSSKLLILCQQGIKTDFNTKKSPSEHTIFQKGVSIKTCERKKKFKIENGFEFQIGVF